MTAFETDETDQLVAYALHAAYITYIMHVPHSNIFTIYVVYILLYIRLICVYTLANAPLGMRAGGAAYFPRAGQGKGYNSLINNVVPFVCR